MCKLRCVYRALFLKKLILVGRQEIRQHGIQAIPAIWNYAYDEETHRGDDLIEIARNIKRKGYSSLGKHQSIAQSKVEVEVFNFTVSEMGEGSCVWS